MLVPCLLVIDDARARFVTRDPLTTPGSRNLPRSRRTATIGCGEKVTGHWKLQTGNWKLIAVHLAIRGFDDVVSPADALPRRPNQPFKIYED
jgi:hypothetical protein